MPIKINCQICSKTFKDSPSRSRRKFCSVFCYYEWQKKIGMFSGQNNPHWRGGTIEKRICSICQKDFLARRHTPQKYCGRNCFSEALRRVNGRDHYLWNQKEVKCNQCGRIFTVDPERTRRGRKNYYCSNKCYGLSKRGRSLSMKTRIKISYKNTGRLPKNINQKGIWANVKRGYFEIPNRGKIFFRSKWEANYALYLNFLLAQAQIERWEYEPKAFVFDAIKFGTRSYRPDFKVWSNGKVEYHEVKGWMTERSVTQIKRMKRYHPEINLVLINSRAYAEIKNKLGTLLKFF